MRRYRELRAAGVPILCALGWHSLHEGNCWRCGYRWHGQHAGSWAKADEGGEGA